MHPTRSRLVPLAALVALVGATAPLGVARAGDPAPAAAAPAPSRAWWQTFAPSRGREVAGALGTGGGTWGMAVALDLDVRAGPVVLGVTGDMQGAMDPDVPMPGDPAKNADGLWLGAHLRLAAERPFGATALRVELGPEAGVHRVDASVEYGPGEGGRSSYSRRVPFAGGAVSGTLLFGFGRAGVRVFARKDLRGLDCPPVVTPCADMSGASTWGFVLFGGLQVPAAR